MKAAGKFRIRKRGSPTFNRLLKNTHLLCCAHHSSLRRTIMYASFLMISRALHLDIFKQPGENYFFNNLLRISERKFSTVFTAAIFYQADYTMQEQRHKKVLQQVRNGGLFRLIRRLSGCADFRLRTLVLPHRPPSAAAPGISRGDLGGGKINRAVTGDYKNDAGKEIPDSCDPDRPEEGCADKKDFPSGHLLSAIAGADC